MIRRIFDCQLNQEKEASDSSSLEFSSERNLSLIIPSLGFGCVTECSCNSGVLGGAPRSSLPGEF